MRTEQSSPAQSDVAAEPLTPDSLYNADAKADAGTTADAKATDAAPAKAQEADPKAEAKTEAKPQVKAPEKYSDFTMPEGVKLEGPMATEFQGIAKELDLTQEQAQKLMTLHGTSIAGNQKAIQAAHAEQVKAWADETRADPTIGGTNLDKNLALAKSVIDTHADASFVKLLNDSGLGNHPSLVRAFMSIGKQLSPDTIPAGAKSAPANDPDSWRKLYKS